MKTLNKELLGFEVPIVGVAENLAELVELCGGEDRVVALANNYVLYHQHYTKGRDLIIKTLVEKSGIKLEVDDKGKVTEQDTEYVGRIEEELKGLSQFEADVASALETLSVDYKQPVRGIGGTGAVAKKWLAYYDGLVEDGKLDTFVAKHELDLEGLDDEGVKNLVAKKIKEVVKRAEQAALAAATSL